MAVYGDNGDNDIMTLDHGSMMGRNLGKLDRSHRTGFTLPTADFTVFTVLSTLLKYLLLAHRRRTGRQRLVKQCRRTTAACLVGRVQLYGVLYSCGMRIKKVVLTPHGHVSLVPKIHFHITLGGSGGILGYSQSRLDSSPF